MALSFTLRRKESDFAATVPDAAESAVASRGSEGHAGQPRSQLRAGFRSWRSMRPAFCVWWAVTSAVLLRKPASRLSRGAPVVRGASFPFLQKRYAQLASQRTRPFFPRIPLKFKPSRAKRKQKNTKRTQCIRCGLKAVHSRVRCRTCAAGLKVVPLR